MKLLYNNKTYEFECKFLNTYIVYNPSMLHPGRIEYLIPNTDLPTDFLKLLFSMFESSNGFFQKRNSYPKSRKIYLFIDNNKSYIKIQEEESRYFERNYDFEVELSENELKRLAEIAANMTRSIMNNMTDNIMPMICQWKKEGFENMNLEEKSELYEKSPELYEALYHIWRYGDSKVGLR